MAPRRSGKNKGKQPAEENDQDVEMAVIQPEEPLRSHLEVFKNHYFNHDVSQNPSQEERDICHYCQIRTFSTHSQYPIAIINTVDDVSLPSNFRFIEESILRGNIKRSDKEFHVGCECNSDNDCSTKNCQCLQDMTDEDLQKPKCNWYYESGPKTGLMREEKIGSRFPVYECHEKCGCRAACSNRVVGNGRKIPLVIFKTKDRGWGVRSTVDIEKGAFIDLYLGEIINNKEAMDRRDKSNHDKRKDVYLFELDKFHDPNSADPVLRAPPHEVDGEFFSGPTRFINHSCDPNLRIFARVADHSDKLIHDLAFFAIKNIEAGVELTFDYVDGAEEGNTQDQRDPEKKKDMTKCLCRSKDCRGYLW